MCWWPFRPWRMGLPTPALVVNRCQGRVIVTQPRLTASKRDGRRAAFVGYQRAVRMAADQFGIMGQAERGLHLAGVVVGLGEDVAKQVLADHVPVAEEQMGRRAAVQLAQHPFELVPAWLFSSTILRMPVPTSDSTRSLVMW